MQNTGNIDADVFCVSKWPWTWPRCMLMSSSTFPWITVSLTLSTSSNATSKTCALVYERHNVKENGSGIRYFMLKRKTWRNSSNVRIFFFVREQQPSSNFCFKCWIKLCLHVTSACASTCKANNGIHHTKWRVFTRSICISENGPGTHPLRVRLHHHWLNVILWRTRWRTRRVTCKQSFMKLISKDQRQTKQLFSQLQPN